MSDLQKQIEKCEIAINQSLAERAKEDGDVYRIPRDDRWVSVEVDELSTEVLHSLIELVLKATGPTRLTFVWKATANTLSIDWGSLLVIRYKRISVSLSALNHLKNAYAHEVPRFSFREEPSNRRY